MTPITTLVEGVHLVKKKLHMYTNTMSTEEENHAADKDENRAGALVIMLFWIIYWVTEIYALYEAFACENDKRRLEKILLTMIIGPFGLAYKCNP